MRFCTDQFEAGSISLTVQLEGLSKLEVFLFCVVVQFYKFAARWVNLTLPLEGSEQVDGVVFRCFCTDLLMWCRIDWLDILA